MKLLTSSKLGLGITTGAGARDSRKQSDFRTEMIAKYGAKHPTEDWLWCPILSSWLRPQFIQAAHLFAQMHGQDTMDAIFGTTKPPELFSGLLICDAIERIFDSGKIVIVPDLPERPQTIQVLAWLQKPGREYKVRIID
jgi:hypothetical protein